MHYLHLEYPRNFLQDYVLAFPDSLRRPTKLNGVIFGVAVLVYIIHIMHEMSLCKQIIYVATVLC